MENRKTFKLVLTGGGTAGHVWPHFALIDSENSALGKSFREGNLEVHYLGSTSGMERDIVENSGLGWKYKGIQTGKLRRFFSLKNFTDPFRIVAGFFQAFLYLRKVKASAVFSKGGYVSAPVVWAAWLNSIPVVIHESDVTPALTTRLTLPFSYRALVAFQETVHFLSPVFKKRVMHVGLPLRQSLFSAQREDAIKHFGLDPSKKTVLIFGGSLGAAELNRRLMPAIPELATRYNVIHIVGKGKSLPVEPLPSYRQFEFLNDEMRLAYACADMAICRAGASSIFELAAARIPMVLVPLGSNASRGDQIINAQVFERHGWARRLPEDQLTKESALLAVDDMMASLDEKKQALTTAPAPDAADKVGSLLMNLMERYEQAKSGA